MFSLSSGWYASAIFRSIFFYVCNSHKNPQFKKHISAIRVPFIANLSTESSQAYFTVILGFKQDSLKPLLWKNWANQLKKSVTGDVFILKLCIVPI